MARGDATIDIPLEQVPTNNTAGGLRNQTSTTYLQPKQNDSVQDSEKRPYFRGRRAKTPTTIGQAGRIGADGEEDVITTMGKIYATIWSFSLITRYFLIVLPLALVIAVPITIGKLNDNNHHPVRLAGVPLWLFFLWVEIVWLSIWVAKIVAHYLPAVFQGLAGVVSSGVRKYAMVIRALEIPLSLVGWAVTCLATFKPLMTLENVAQSWINTMEKVLAASVVASLIYLGEKTIIQLISISYHRKQFSYRIKDSKHSIYLLGLLYEASRKLFPAYCNEFAEEDYIISDQLNISPAANSKDHDHGRSGSATPMRLLHNIGRYGDKLTSAFGNVAQEITGKEVFNPNSAHSIVIQALEHNRSSEALAKRIWMSCVVEGREALFQDDIEDVLGPARKKEAEEAFSALDCDGNGDISLDEMILTVTELGRERKSIANSMHDVDQAINVLDGLLCVVVFAAVMLVFVAFLNTNFTTTLATTGTALLSLSFVFAASCQEVLGSCIFLFVKHPFDIGDRVDINVDQFVVEHISLLFTVFKRSSGKGVGRLVQIPNIVLNTLFIENVSRSKAMSEQLEVDVFFGTTFEDIQILRNELQTFVLDKENSRDFLPQIEVGILGTTDQSKLQLQLELRHKGNWHNDTVRQARRSKFMCALVSALKAVPIYAPGGGGDPAGSAANPNYSVSILDDEAKANAATSAQLKDEARLVPPKKTSPFSAPLSVGAAGLTQREQTIVGDLTSRNPASDPTRDGAWTSSREDTITLGDRQSLDRQDLDEVRGLLRRASTKGKRKTPSEEKPSKQLPSVPTITELQHASNPNSSPYETQGAGYSTLPAAYQPVLRASNTQYQSTQTFVPAQSQLEQMSPVAPARKASNPYRKQSDSVSRKPLSPTAGVGERREAELEHTRPYSGV